MNQSIRADQYRGKRVHFGGYVKVFGPGSAFLWMQVDGATTSTRDAMDDWPIRSLTNWQQFGVVLDVPDDAISIAFGVGAHGYALFDDLQLEIVGDDVPVTKETTKLESHQTPLDHVQSRY